MKQRTLCAALAAIGLSVTAAAAEPVRIAQVAPAVMLPAYEIATIVRSAGFNPLSPAMRRGETYVLRAIGPDGREMRLVVDARSGAIISAMAVVPAAREALPGERLGPYERMGPYEPVPPDGYVGPPGAYDAGPPVVYEGGRPMRPMQPIPNAPRRAAVPDAEDDVQFREPSVIMAPERGDSERGEHGLLPPPPERFPQRAAPPAAAKPAAKPAPVKRAAAPPPATPLPKPRPAVQPGPPPASDASPLPPPLPASKVDSRALPH